MTRPYPDTSLWTAPSPLQPSPFLHNTPVPQPTFAQTSHPSPQGYQPSPQYISPSLPLSQAFLPSGSYSNNDHHATATSCPHTPNVVPLSPHGERPRNRSSGCPSRLRRPSSLMPCFRYSSLRTDAGYNNIVPTIIHYSTSRGTTTETRGTSQKFLPLFCYFLYYLNAETDKRSHRMVTFQSSVGLKYVMVKDVWTALHIYAPHILCGAQCPSNVKWEHLRRILRSAVKDTFKD
ncbi:hypothetical protein CPB85DRAFT_540918 [Mucidula mucida]|nr:hypothetical protein CPB85DRAFT_540918 [Mucidula mucida]